MISVNSSEIAQIRQRITDESLAATLGLCGLSSGNARHQFITAKTENIGKHFEELHHILGSSQKALQFIGEAMTDAEHPTRYDIRSSLARELANTEENAQLLERLEDAWELCDMLTERFGAKIAHTILDVPSGIFDEVPS